MTVYEALDLLFFIFLVPMLSYFAVQWMYEAFKITGKTGRILLAIGTAPVYLPLAVFVSWPIRILLFHMPPFRFFI